MYTYLRFVLYRAINNDLDQRKHWILKRISKSRLSDALDARKYFWLQTCFNLNLENVIETRPNRQPPNSTVCPFSVIENTIPIQ
jgi:hypothetical protein